MNMVSVTAETLEEALAQIQKKMGPDAVVVNVRKVPAQGVSRLWKQFQGVEVSAMPAPAGTLLDQRDETEITLDKPVKALPQSDGSAGMVQSQVANLYTKASARGALEETPSANTAKPVHEAMVEPVSPLPSILTSMGILPVFHEMIQRKMDLLFSDRSDRVLSQEMQALRMTLFSYWRDYPVWQKGNCPHIFIGPPGTGKSTILCKFLVQSVLSSNESAHVWRLDGKKANNADFLSIHAEILGVPVERSWSGKVETTADHTLIDIPGVSLGDKMGMAELQKMLKEIGGAQVHLVLNAAYEPQTLIRQYEAFKEFRPQDILLTHLDEESRVSKLWNVVLGTKIPISYLGAGQNIPGKLIEATPSAFLPGENVRI